MFVLSEGKKKSSSDSFRSSDLRVMSPARFHCATLLGKYYFGPPTVITSKFESVRFYLSIVRYKLMCVILVNSVRT